MKTIALLAVFALSGCSTYACFRRAGPHGPTPCPDEMPQGRVECNALCGSYGRDMLEYTYDGECVCRPDPNAKKAPTPGQTLNPNNQG